MASDCKGVHNIQFKLRLITGAQLEIASAPFEATAVSGSYGNNKHKQTYESSQL